MQNPTLDVRGLKCPMPALFARRAMARAPGGFTLEVVSDDPLAAIDVPHMCRQEGYEVLDICREPSLTRFILRRPG